MMRRARRLWILIFVAMTLLAGCGGRATPVARPPVIAATSTPEAVAAAPERGGGGISAHEPTLAVSAPSRLLGEGTASNSSKRASAGWAWMVGCAG